MAENYRIRQSSLDVEYSNIRSRIFDLALSNPNPGFWIFVEPESRVWRPNIRIAIHCMNDTTPTSVNSTWVFVVANREENVNAPVFIFRTYFGPQSLAGKCHLWEAARATSAGSTFFKPIYIKEYTMTFVDGGLGYNNPSQSALDEAKIVWPDCQHFVLVSIGTGHPRALSLGESVEPQTVDKEQKFFFEYVTKYIPRIKKVPGVETAINFPKGVATVLTMAKAMKSIATDSEKAHERMSRHSRMTKDYILSYFRFNVERDVGDIGMEEAKKSLQIAAHTSAYLALDDSLKKRARCTKYFIHPATQTPTSI